MPLNFETARNLSSRNLFFIGCLICAFLILAAFFMQYVLKLEPCPLCMVQRVIVLCLGIIFSLACLHNPKKIVGRIYCILLILFSTLGIATAGRHVWLQHYPNAQSTRCGASLEYMLNTLPFHDTMKLLFMGSGECSKVTWTFLGLSIAEMTLITFILLLAYSIFCYIQQK